MSNPPNAYSGDTLLIRGPHLVITLPDNRQETHTISQGIIRIGREKENNDIVLPNAYSSISRQHLEIHQFEGDYQVLDLDSTNGVFLNKVRIETSAILKDGDEIWIGTEAEGEHVRITFHHRTPLFEMQQEIKAEIESVSLGDDFQNQPPTELPYLKIHWPDGLTNYFSIRKRVTRIGRGGDSELELSNELRYISKKHAEIRRLGSNFTITDLGSTNGTRVNDQALKADTPFKLVQEAIIRIGDERLGSSIGLTFHNPTVAHTAPAGYTPTMVEPALVPKERVVLIGRHQESDIILDTPKVSRKHARVQLEVDTYWIEDLESTNGTYINDVPVIREELHEGDLITIGDHILVFQDGQLSQFQSHGMRLDVSNLSKDVNTRSGPLRILHSIDMTILPREFIAIVGGSGAGKSTLMNALIGFRPGDGSVELNGHDFYEDFEHFRSQIGYVPQSDILHTSLTVEKALDYAAQLRLPTDVNADERGKRISEVLETVNMNSEVIRQTRIGNLSGGQRKRVSIAAELLADPKLIYLDEATSGLDPGLEKKMMYTLRRMADEGRTVILITHATANIVQTDHVAFLSQGKLVYFGPSQEALDFFEINDFADIYERIEGHGEEWEHVFHESKPEHYEEYVLARKVDKKLAAKRDLPKIQFGMRDFFRQFAVLTQRAFNVLMSDRFTLMLMLLLFPLTATLQLMISTSNILVGDLSILADPAAAAAALTDSYLPFANLNTFVFVMGLEAVLVGMYVPSNELIKERTVYLRERMVNLKVLPYLFSKVGVFALFASIQTFLYLIVLSFGVDLPEQGLLFPGPIELFVTLYLTMLASMGIGFVVSAVSRSSDMAIYVLVILLFFQFFFAGTVFDLRDNVAQPLSYVTATRWSLIALGVTIDMEEQVGASIVCNPQAMGNQQPGNGLGRGQCFHYPDAVEDLMLPYGDENLIQSWIILIAMALVTITVAGVLVKRLDS